MSEEWFLTLAIEEAEKGYRLGEVPVGAVIVDKDNKIISRAHNLKEKNNDPTAHAEILAIREASNLLGNWRLTGCTLYVTLEPCLMCLSAIQQARIGRVVFGAYDFKSGSISKGFNLNSNPNFNHQFSVLGGLKNYECSRMMSNFFKGRR